MKSIDVANYLIERFGTAYAFTNMKLNKLVFFMQVESLKTTGNALFNDKIEAWNYGPVEPLVYYAFKGYGNGIIYHPTELYRPPLNVADNLSHIADTVMKRYGELTAFDLMNLSHRPGGAWEKTFQKGANAIITDQCIASSTDSAEFAQNATLAAGIKNVENKWPNALRMLENS